MKPLGVSTSSYKVQGTEGRVPCSTGLETPLQDAAAGEAALRAGDTKETGRCGEWALFGH